MPFLGQGASPWAMSQPGSDGRCGATPGLAGRGLTRESGCRGSGKRALSWPRCPTARAAPAGRAVRGAEQRVTSNPENRYSGTKGAGIAPGRCHETE